MRRVGAIAWIGIIAIGSNAELAIWNPERQVTNTNDILHHNDDYTPYEGMKVQGLPETVLSRGTVVVEQGIVVGAEDGSRFLSCELPRPARPEDSRAAS